jgi:hypothetical protein
MTIQKKTEALQNALENYKFPKKFFIQIADGRIGHKFAIASKTEDGGLNIHSNFMTYDEFNAYLFGWYDATMKKF